RQKASHFSASLFVAVKEPLSFVRSLLTRQPLLWPGDRQASRARAGFLAARQGRVQSERQRLLLATKTGRLDQYWQEMRLWRQYVKMSHPEYQHGGLYER